MFSSRHDLDGPDHSYVISFVPRPFAFQCYRCCCYRCLLYVTRTTFRNLILDITQS